MRLYVPLVTRLFLFLPLLCACYCAFFMLSILCGCTLARAAFHGFLSLLILYLRTGGLGSAPGGFASPAGDMNDDWLQRQTLRSSSRFAGDGGAASIDVLVLTTLVGESAVRHVFNMLWLALVSRE
jgi:hypothetical protein